jgi:hypothetical protein
VKSEAEKFTRLSVWNPIVAYLISLVCRTYPFASFTETLTITEECGISNESFDLVSFCLFALHSGSGKVSQTMPWIISDHNKHVHDKKRERNLKL